MTLGFMTTFSARMGGGPTHFVEKTWNSFDDDFVHDNFTEYSNLGLDGKIYNFSDDAIDMHPKLHAIQEDPHDRWKVGVEIRPAIRTRTRIQHWFQFAPILECKGTQKIWIEHAGDVIVMDIGGRPFFYWGPDDYNPKLDKIARNDGFDSIEHFFQWFNKDFTGKLISWTDIKY